MTVLRDDVTTQLRDLTGEGQVLCACPLMKEISYRDYSVSEEVVVGKKITEVTMENGIVILLSENDSVYGEDGKTISTRKIRRHTSLLAYRSGILSSLKVSQTKLVSLKSLFRVTADLPVLICGVPVQCGT
jgi:hypothetical protein